MNIAITGRNVEVGSALKKYAEDKISRFERYLSNITEANITFSVQKQNHKAEVLIKANGVIIQAEGTTGEFFSAIDDVAAKMERQVKKHKEKMVAHRKSAKGKALVAVPSAPKETGIIITRNPYEMKPMSPEEAAVNLDMLDKTFFVFTNDQTGKTNVIYKMSDKNFGLIEPEA